jgi:hypothetical protein
MIAQNKFLVWNCRGAASTAFFRYCKHYVVNHCPGVLVILETRCEPVKLRKTFKLLGFDGFLASEVRGYAGGIVVGWKSESIHVSTIQCKFQFMLLKVHYTNGKDWYFSPIYASPNEENRKMLWEDLKHIAGWMKEPWMLAGDFNDIACPSEKKGGVRALVRRCNTFVERMNACKLIDLGFVGSKYTWRGPIFHGGGRIFERLDRALSNDSWRLEFPDAFIKTLPRLDFSDHHPILICPFGNEVNKVLRRFRFESAWHLHENYNAMVKSCWSAGNNILANLKNLQSEFKEWNFSTFNEVLRKKKRLEARICGIQTRMATRHTSYG